MSTVSHFISVIPKIKKTMPQLYRYQERDQELAYNFFMDIVNLDELKITLETESAIIAESDTMIVTLFQTNSIK